MLKGIDVNQRIEYVCKEDDSEPKTVFVFRPMTASEMIDLTSDMDVTQLKMTGKKIIDFLCMAIVEIRNYHIADIREALNSLPPTVITELVQESTNINKIVGTDIKN
jgi:hypothetical protein